MTIENEKLDCSDALVFGLNRTAGWRKKMLVQYPGDPRNGRAAECLTKLATDAAALSDEDWLRLKPHVGGWANEHWRDAITEAGRAVGFKQKIIDLSSFVDHLVFVLSKPSSVAA